ncbi:MAG: Transcriptional repressor NrdR [Spirochaetes bacterium ADurb.Bin315]|jgi:transcriptional repressor NrdR|nr:transcriptional regulator NrdR [Spirochaetota bacterium]NLL24333.1 transcriptional repressor NrdR [Spirochaetales bacterium]OQA44329.1 MAG: Transcriptional repressor NrdR [Spirochaetes bacterium ADurb.Bin315]TAH56440.1 MAG: transcriptional repressor NrdR [Sphaerochaeta sp.]HOE89500.1 transcriptional regulator NrdR [Sphaerochaeta sp.]
MRCPRCSSLEDKVLESRQNASGTAIRRRRECLSCGYRSTSYERIEDKPVMVIKRDGRREMFDISKVGRGIRSCTEKLSISEHQIETLLQNIEDAIMLKLGNRREISSTEIGEEALKQLKTVDLVAYVRFAAVYKAFNDIEQFIGEIKQLDKELN